MTKTEKIFKENIKKLREQKGITRYRLATTLKIHKAYYYAMENMERTQSPTYEMLEKLAEFYGVEVYELFMEKAGKEDGLAQTVTEWWSEHQYDTEMHGDDEYNTYDEIPEFVKKAKEIMQKNKME